MILEGPAELETLEKYPLVVAIVDGRVEHVCPHPEDQPWSVNLKKAVPAQLQNALPSFAAAIEDEGMTFTEVTKRSKVIVRMQIDS